MARQPDHDRVVTGGTDGTMTMIQLTDTDPRLYLVRFDTMNLAIIKGEPKARNKAGDPVPHANQVMGYYGSAREAFTKAIDIALKHEYSHFSASEVLHRIDDLTEHIKRACADIPSMTALMSAKDRE